jgi:hypothetical protein
MLLTFISSSSFFFFLMDYSFKIQTMTVVSPKKKKKKTSRTTLDSSRLVVVTPNSSWGDAILIGNGLSTPREAHKPLSIFFFFFK